MTLKSFGSRVWNGIVVFVTHNRTHTVTAVIAAVIAIAFILRWTR